MVLAELVRSDADSAAPVENLKDVARGAKNGAEAEAIQRALQQTGWNKKRAATLLKISYKALLYKIQEYGIRAPAARARFQP
jgi:two-component system, NtrC family, response regulator AtoC